MGRTRELPRKVCKIHNGMCTTCTRVNVLAVQYSLYYMRVLPCWSEYFSIQATMSAAYSYCNQEHVPSFATRSPRFWQTCPIFRGLWACPLVVTILRPASAQEYCTVVPVLGVVISSFEKDLTDVVLRVSAQAATIPARDSHLDADWYASRPSY